MVRSVSAFGMIAALEGCELGPDFHRPSVWSPTTFDASHGPTLANEGGTPSVTTDAPPSPEWWRVFGDPELTSLEQRVARSNLSVREATFRLVESRAQRMSTRAALFPQLNGNGEYLRAYAPNRLIQRTLQNSVSNLPISNPTIDGIRQEVGETHLPPVDLWTDGIDASYEVDLWGRVRRQVESATAQVEESADTRRSMLISAEAEIARDYVQLRGLQAELAIQRENLVSAQQSLVLSQQRYAGGLVTELDVDQARAQVETTASQIPNDEQQATEEINAIGLLLGEPPQALASELAAAQPIPPIPPAVPVGLPSELVLRRPDVREASAALHAATAQTGVAVASFYPRLTLTGNLDEIALQFRDLFTWQSVAATFGPSVSLPIFEGGRLRAQLRLSKAQQAEAAVNYEQVVLQAWRDVDNALTAYAAEQKRREQLSASVASARRSLDLSTAQYAHGLTNFLNVLDAQRTLLQSQQQLVNSTATVSSNLVQLYTALGGGWEQTFPAADAPRITGIPVAAVGHRSSEEQASLSPASP